MPDSIRVDGESLAAACKAAQAEIRRARLPEALIQYDGGPYGLSPSLLELLHGLETMVGTAAALETVLPGPRAAWIAWNVGVQEALRRVPGEVGVTVGGSFADADVVRIVADGPRTLLQDCLHYLEFYRSHADADKRSDVAGGPQRCVRAWLQLLEATLTRLLRREGSGHLRIDLPGVRYDGIHRVETLDATELMDVALDDIVGNEDFVRSGQRLARDVAGFDLETGENPKRLNPILFAMGEPGCGKTVTCHALGRYFLAFCAQRNVPARFLVIRRSDWASSYQNASAAQLIDIFKHQVAGFPGVVGVYWPDIDTAFAARDDPGVRGEEKNILGACFGIFDGTIIPKNGQWFMLCDANTLNMDRAAVSRITQDPFTLRGPVTVHDVVVLMRDKKLGQHRAFLTLETDEWERLAARCVELRLSGRALDNICRRVVTDIEDFEYPDEYFQASLARRREILAERSQAISLSHLEGIVEHYQAFERDVEERSQRARFQERVGEIVFNLSAQAAAARALAPPETHP